MGLFGGSREKRERRALEQFLEAPSVDEGQIEQLKRECQDPAALLHDVVRQSQNQDHRFRALVGLNALVITPAMVPALVDALRDEDDFVQETAAKVLRTHREHAAAVLPAVLADYAEHPAHRRVLLQVLADYGPAAKQAVPAIRDGLKRPLEALSAARCLASVGCDDLTDVEQAMVALLTDHASSEQLKALGSPLQSALEAFLLACVPWRAVDAIPAWRRALEAYAEITPRPADALLPVLNELAQFSDWRLRGEVSAQFLEMSRAKGVAEKLVKRAAQA